MATRIQLQWIEYNTDVVDRMAELKRLTPSTLDATTTLNDVETITIDSGLDFDTITAHALLSDEYSLDFRSNFTSAVDMFGGNSVSSLLQTITKAQSVLTGTTSSLTALFDYQLWEKTEPIKLNVEVTFMLDTNAELDVWLPTMSLCSLAALTEYDGSYLVPGIHFDNLRLVESGRKKEQGDPGNGGDSVDAKSLQPIDAIRNGGTQFKSKFLSITMPAFSNELMLVNDAKPTFSKHVDEKGYPIWSKVQLDLQTLFPASSDQLFRGLK